MKNRRLSIRKMTNIVRENFANGECLCKNVRQQKETGSDIMDFPLPTWNKMLSMTPRKGRAYSFFVWLMPWWGIVNTDGNQAKKKIMRKKRPDMWNNLSWILYQDNGFLCTIFLANKLITMLDRYQQISHHTMSTSL